MIGTNLGGYFTFSTLGYAFVLLPLTELILNPDETNFTNEEAEKCKDKFLFAFSLLKAVNYIEHYGLERKFKADGKFEKVESFHSWNSNFPISRWVLFELTRHSDHHLHASLKYQVLNNIKNSPEHPTGYPGMIFLALVPPLWKKVMDKRVIEEMNYSDK